MSEKITDWFGVWIHGSDNTLFRAAFKDHLDARRWAKRQFGAEKNWIVTKIQASDLNTD